MKEPLGSGEYKAVWKIVGEDGHPLKGTISFIVQVPDQEQIGSERKNDIGEKEAKDINKDIQEQGKESNPSPINAKDDKEMVNFSMQWLLLPFVILTILIMTFFIFRKDKK